LHSIGPDLLFGFALPQSCLRRSGASASTATPSRHTHIPYSGRHKPHTRKHVKLTHAHTNCAKRVPFRRGIASRRSIRRKSRRCARVATSECTPRCTSWVATPTPPHARSARARCVRGTTHRRRPDVRLARPAQTQAFDARLDAHVAALAKGRPPRAARTRHAEKTPKHMHCRGPAQWLREAPISVGSCMLHKSSQVKSSG
jgi:hypothetical protein